VVFLAIYEGMTASLPGAVCLLDSPWCLDCFGLYLVLIILRTWLEDPTLQAELPGYAEYAAPKRRKFKLLSRITFCLSYEMVSGIWRRNLRTSINLKLLWLK
jgi:hypothetical protein